MSVFSQPDWPDVDVDFDVMPRDAASILSAAAEARRYSEPRRPKSQGHLRLGGEVDGSRVALTAKPYVIPGVRAGLGSLTLLLRGTILARQGGSRLEGKLSAPIPPLGLLVAIVWAAFLVAISGDLRVAILFAPAIPLVWLGLRYNQRQALKWDDDVRDFLRSLVVEGSDDIRER